MQKLHVGWCLLVQICFAAAMVDALSPKGQLTTAHQCGNRINKA
jgi:hypothetical protein